MCNSIQQVSVSFLRLVQHYNRDRHLSNGTIPVGSPLTMAAVRPFATNDPAIACVDADKDCHGKHHTLVTGRHINDRGPHSPVLVGVLCNLTRLHMYTVPYVCSIISSSSSHPHNTSDLATKPFSPDRPGT